MTSTTKHRPDATADCLILSTSRTMLFSAVSAPMLSSDPGRSLLIEAGRQTIGMASAGWSSGGGLQCMGSLVAGPAANHEQPVDPVGFDLSSDGVELRRRTARTGLCPARHRHATPSR